MMTGFTCAQPALIAFKSFEAIHARIPKNILARLNGKTQRT